MIHLHLAIPILKTLTLVWSLSERTRSWGVWSVGLVVGPLLDLGCSHVKVATKGI